MTTKKYFIFTKEGVKVVTINDSVSFSFSVKHFLDGGDKVNGGGKLQL